MLLILRLGAFAFFCVCIYWISNMVVRDIRNRSKERKERSEEIQKAYERGRADGRKDERAGRVSVTYPSTPSKSNNDISV